MIFLNAPLEILNKKITPSDKLFFSSTLVC